MFVVSLTYVAELNEIDQHLDAHVDYLNRCYDAGIFLASGRKVPRTGGVILAQAENRAALDAVLQQDPFFVHRLAAYDVTEFEPTRTSAALDFLRS
ncbi:YciI family protein [Thalassolituus sp. LLYu03]|uniref:YciI family protein n=1 Tax=Thalassolituus sp. LLYu03 TaxID=3421656 RepID=UPI003D291BA7